MKAVQLLVINATIQVFISALLGLLLLIPMQPWGKHFLKSMKNPRDLMSTHLDWFMLAFMQYGVAFGLSIKPVSKEWLVSVLLVFGGWMNATPYLIRGIWGIDAFSLSGSPKQIVAASLGLISVLSILVALGILLVSWILGLTI